MGRELVHRLAAQGCSVAACDLNADAVAAVVAKARTDAARRPGHWPRCDVSAKPRSCGSATNCSRHASDHVDLVFSNAGMGGGGSFISDSARNGSARSPSTGGVSITAPERSCTPSHRQRRRRPGQHQQRERPLSVRRPEIPNFSCFLQVRRSGLLGGTHRGPALARARGPRRRRNARTRGDRHHREQLPRSRPALPEQMSDAQVDELIPPDARAGLIRGSACWPRTRQPVTCARCLSG